MGDTTGTVGVAARSLRRSPVNLLYTCMTLCSLQEEGRSGANGSQ